MMDDQLITNCLSTTVRSWKETVWQNHFFAALYCLLPVNYRIDTENRISEATKKRDSINYRIHGAEFIGSVEWVLSEFPLSTPPDTISNYILERYYRFVKNPLNRPQFVQKYRLLKDEPFVVVNVSHKKLDVHIEGKIPLTYVDLIIDEEYQVLSRIFKSQVFLVDASKPKIGLRLATMKGRPKAVTISNTLDQLIALAQEKFQNKDVIEIWDKESFHVDDIKNIDDEILYAATNDDVSKEATVFL